MTRSYFWSPDPDVSDNLITKVGPFTLRVWESIEPGEWNWSIDAAEASNPEMAVSIAVAAPEVVLRTESGAVEDAERALLAIADVIKNGVR